MTKVFCCKTKRLLRFSMLFLFGAGMLVGCKDDFDGYFDYPKDIEGPIYEQLSKRSELSEFVKAIDKIPLMKKIINTSGLYTVFAPTNDAVKNYFSTQTRYPGKKSVADFNVEEVVTDENGNRSKPDSILLSQFIEAHFVIDMYFNYDFKRFIPDEIIGSGSGMGSIIIISDRNRYSTRYRDQKYLDTVVGRYYMDGNNRLPLIRKVRPQYKAVTVYPFKYLRRHNIVNEFMELYGITQKPTGDDLYVNGVKVTTADIPAVNGVVHIVDGVIEPKENLEMLIKRYNPTMWAIYQNYASYTFNSAATETEGTSKFDSIFNKKYGMMNISDENSRMLFTLLLPGQAYEDFVRDSIFPVYNINPEDYAPEFPNSDPLLHTPMDSIPSMLRSALLGQFAVPGTLWQSQLDYGFTNAYGDTLQAKDQPKRPANIQIKGKEVSSNGLIYRLSDDTKYISPLFKTIARVPLLDKRLRWYLDLASSSNLISTLTRHWMKYTVFIPTKRAFYADKIIMELKDGITATSTSLYINNGSERVTTIQSDSILKSLIIPDVLLEPGDLKDLRFVKTLQGNFVQIRDNKLFYTYLPAGVQFNGLKRDSSVIMPDSVIRTVNGNVYILNEKLPMPSNITLNYYINQQYASKNSLFKKILSQTKVNGEIWADSVKGWVANDNTTLLQMVMSQDFKATDIYTVLYPTDQALKDYAKSTGFMGDPALISDFSTNTFENKCWQRIARQLVLRTRVYSDSSHYQNYYGIYANPVEGAEREYLTMCYSKLVSAKNYFDNNEFTSVKLDFFGKDGITITELTSSEEPVSVHTSGTINMECKNGVLHEINKIPFPVYKSQAAWRESLEIPKGYPNVIFP